jgi:hypothetical protein
VLFSTAIGVLVFVLKLGVSPVLLGTHSAYKVVEAVAGKTDPAGTFVPEPSAAEFHPVKLYPYLAKFPVLFATGFETVVELH